MTNPDETPDPDETPYLPFEALIGSGLLWMINRNVFHPRGFALGLVTTDDGEVVGWNLQGDGSEVWQFPQEVDTAMFQRAEQTLELASNTMRVLVSHEPPDFRRGKEGDPNHGCTCTVRDAAEGIIYDPDCPAHGGTS